MDKIAAPSLAFVIGAAAVFAVMRGSPEPVPAEISAALPTLSAPMAAVLDEAIQVASGQPCAWTLATVRTAPGTVDSVDGPVTILTAKCPGGETPSTPILGAQLAELSKEVVGNSVLFRDDMATRFVDEP